MPSASKAALLASGLTGLRLLGQHQRAQPARAPRAQRSRGGIEGDRLALLDLVGKARLDFGEA